MRSERASGQIDIGDGHRRAPVSIGNRAGCRARALRPDPQGAAGIDPGDAPTARSDRLDVNDGNRERERVDHGLGRPTGSTADDCREVRTRATHVERQKISLAGRPSHRDRCRDSARRSAQDHVDRSAHNGSMGDHPAG